MLLSKLVHLGVLLVELVALQQLCRWQARPILYMRIKSSCYHLLWVHTCTCLGIACHIWCLSEVAGNWTCCCSSGNIVRRRRTAHVVEVRPSLEELGLRFGGLRWEALRTRPWNRLLLIRHRQFWLPQSIVLIVNRVVVVLLLRGIGGSYISFEHYLLLRFFHGVVDKIISLTVHDLNESALVGFLLRNWIVCSLSLASIGARSASWITHSLF